MECKCKCKFGGVYAFTATSRERSQHTHHISAFICKPLSTTQAQSRAAPTKTHFFSVFLARSSSATRTACVQYSFSSSALLTSSSAHGSTHAPNARWSITFGAPPPPPSADAEEEGGVGLSRSVMGGGPASLGAVDTWYTLIVTKYL
jgi:hypothetical protein